MAPFGDYTEDTKVKQATERGGVWDATKGAITYPGGPVRVKSNFDRTKTHPLTGSPITPVIKPNSLGTAPGPTGPSYPTSSSSGIPTTVTNADSGVPSTMASSSSSGATSSGGIKRMAGGLSAKRQQGLR